MVWAPLSTRWRNRRRHWEAEPHREPATELASSADHSDKTRLCVTLFPRTEKHDHLQLPSRRSSGLSLSQEGENEAEDAPHWVTRRCRGREALDLEKGKPRSGSQSSPKSRPFHLCCSVASPFFQKTPIEPVFVRLKLDAAPTDSEQHAYRPWRSQTEERKGKRKRRKGWEGRPPVPASAGPELGFQAFSGESWERESSFV